MGTSAVAGYYRFPTLIRESVVFVSEDDLWLVARTGGVARRLTSGLGKARSPFISPDGTWLAYSSTEEGPAEVYLMSAEGGQSRRLTYLGGDSRVVGWTPNGEILLASNHQHAFARLTDLYVMSIDDLKLRRLPCGPATHVDFDSRGRMVIARHGGTDLAYWKRYRGGTAGEIWIDRRGDHSFERLLERPINSARPFWLGDRIYFIADHEGVGNVYSVSEDGRDMKRHTGCQEYYARGLSMDAEAGRLIYHAGGDLFVLEAGMDGASAQKIDVQYRSARTQLNRRFVSGGRFLEDFDLHPEGERAVIGARGKVFSFDLWRGPVSMHGPEDTVRYRHGRFLQDGKRLVVVSDASGEESLEIHEVQNRDAIERLRVGLDLGRIVEIKLSPLKDEAIVVNHRNELIFVNLETSEFRKIDSSPHETIRGFNWSPCGTWVAYSRSDSERTSAVFICEVATGEVHQVTKSLLADVSPFFDPSGDYLYFLSFREFDPVYDNLHFDLGFPRGCKPYLLTLRENFLSPFSSDNKGRKGKQDAPQTTPQGMQRLAFVAPLKIDFAGIAERIVAFPVPDGRYGTLAATRGKVYFTRLPIKGALGSDWRPSQEPVADAQLEMFDLESEKMETIVSNISSFRLSHDGQHIIYSVGHTLRVIKAGEKPSEKSTDGDPSKRGGWLDLDRVQIPVRPVAEWRQMYRESWRLQRDHFWTEDMSSVDWARVYTRYLPLLDRVSSRSEVSDVIWEMQGELGTSHAYEIGGDYRLDPSYGIGFLGAEFEYDEKESACRLTQVMKGDLWDEACSSPLARAGVGLEAGDLLLAIDGQALSLSRMPHQCLVQKAGREVSVTFRRRNHAETKTMSVKTLQSEQRLRYREWVDGNRKFVHEKSEGRIGYIHVPNMGPFGYSEFHRHFLTEIDGAGVIIDVRYNGGGHVSQLLLEKLARRRIGYSKSRWFGAYPYPNESPAGAMVALTNEYAGSDGDIFSHSFKLLHLGPLIGKRTWGGVIGISPRHSLVDGSLTTQPEYSYWFQDVGWKVENYGTDPDLEVEYLPSDYVSGRDPQLERGLAVCLELGLKQSVLKPCFDNLPNLTLPMTLPESTL